MGRDVSPDAGSRCASAWKYGDGAAIKESKLINLRDINRTWGQIGEQPLHLSVSFIECFVKGCRSYL